MVGLIGLGATLVALPAGVVIAVLVLRRQ